MGGGYLVMPRGEFLSELAAFLKHLVWISHIDELASVRHSRKLAGASEHIRLRESPPGHSTRRGRRSRKALKQLIRIAQNP